MKGRAEGPFEVKLNALTPYNEDPSMGRRSLDKVFHGGLEATSKGEMLSVAGAVPGSAVYVAIERVSGALDGRNGAFALHHTGIMNRGAPSLSIKVVPDSGADALTGITGSLEIVIADGKHSYVFDYELPD